MIIRKLDSLNSKERSFVENLYLESFPLSERRAEKVMFDLHENNPKFEIDILIENDKYVGFFTYWKLGDFVFAEHFAVSPQARNMGYGYSSMKQFIEMLDGTPIILEVELPTTILSERRIGFYQRIGFKLWEEIQYQQPAYDQERGAAIPMKLMTYGDLDLDKDMGKVKQTLYSEVYNY